MISVFGRPDPNTGFNQSEHVLYTCYFISVLPNTIAVNHIQELFARQKSIIGHSEGGGDEECA